jgi:hypothetical protein
LQTVSVTRYDQSALVEGTVYYNETDLQTGDAYRTGGTGSTLTFSGGKAIVTPTVALAGQVDTLRVGSSGTQNPADPAFAASWPVPWNSDELVKVEYGYSAETDASDQADLFRIMLNPVLQEFFFSSWVQNNAWQPGNPFQGPALGVPQTLVAYFYTHNQSVHADPGTYMMRPRFDMIHNTTVGDIATDIGATAVHSVKVTKIVAAP